jgi:PASTA domain
MSATLAVRRREVLLEDLTGLAAVNAIDRLRELELRPAVEACETDEADQHGLILAHEPSADSRVRRAQLITLVVGQHPDTKAVSRHGRPRDLPGSRPGRPNENRAELAVENEAMSPIAPAEPIADDRWDSQDNPMPSLGPASFTASLDRVRMSPGIEPLLHPPVAVPPETTGQGRDRDGHISDRRRRPTKRRIGRTARALALLAAGVLLAIVGAVAGFHETPMRWPGRAVPPPEPALVTRPAAPTHSSVLRRRVARLRPARRRKTTVHHTRRGLTAEDARATQTHPPERLPHARPSSSPPPSITRHTHVQPRNRAPAAVRAASPLALPPSPAGSLPGPPPT